MTRNGKGTIVETRIGRNGTGTEEEEVKEVRRKEAAEETEERRIEIESGARRIRNGMRKMEKGTGYARKIRIRRGTKTKRGRGLVRRAVIDIARRRKIARKRRRRRRKRTKTERGNARATEREIVKESIGNV